MKRLIIRAREAIRRRLGKPGRRQGERRRGQGILTPDKKTLIIWNLPKQGARGILQALVPVLAKTEEKINEYQYLHF